MLTYKIRKTNSSINWKTFILNDIYLSPDMSFISGTTNSQEPIPNNSKILVKKKDDDTYATYLVSNVTPSIIRGYVHYSRKIPERTISRTVDYFDVNENAHSSKTISSTYIAYNDAVYYKYVYPYSHRVTEATYNNVSGKTYNFKKNKYELFIEVDMSSGLTNNLPASGFSITIDDVITHNCQPSGCKEKFFTDKFTFEIAEEKEGGYGIGISNNVTASTIIIKSISTSNINGYFINDRFYSANSENEIIIDEHAPIESNIAVIDGHPFQIFSDGTSEYDYYLRYNEESVRLTKINDMDYTVEIFEDNSEYEKLQKVILYKTEDETITVDDIKGGGYRYYVTIDDEPYRIRFNEEYDRYGIFYKNKFFPVTYYYDEKPFLPSSNYNYVDTTPKEIVSATTRCMPPFDNHIIRVVDETPVYLFKDTKMISKATTLEKGNYLFVISIESDKEIEGDFAVKFQHDGIVTIFYFDPSNKINYDRFEMLASGDCIISVYDFSNNPLTVSSMSIMNVSPDINNGYMEYVDYTVTESLETDSDGDFLIMMTPDENKYNMGDKIIAKSNTPIESTYDLEYDNNNNEYLMYNGKRYDTIHHAFDTVNMYDEEHRIIYTNDDYTSGYCVINEDIINFKFNTINGEIIAQRTDPMFLKVKKSNTIMSDYLSQSHSGTSGYVHSEYGYFKETVHNTYSESFDLMPGTYTFTADIDTSEMVEGEYYLVIDVDRPEEYTVLELTFFGDTKISGEFTIYGESSGPYQCNFGFRDNSQTYDCHVTATTLTVNNDISWESGYTVTVNDAIKIGTNYYKVFDSNRLIYNNDNDYVESTIRKVTIKEPQEYKFIVRDVLGSGTLLLFPENNNFTYKTETTAGEKITEKTVNTLNSIGMVSDNWENFSYYLLNDIFGEEKVTPEGGLIKMYESFEPVSSWDINKIRSNLDMYQPISYLNIQLPLTTFAVPNPLKEDLRSNIFTNEFADANVNKIVDMEKIPFRLANSNKTLIDRLSICLYDGYSFDFSLNEYGTVPSYVKNSFLRMSFYDSPNTQTQELIGTMCLFFGGASISGNCGTDGLIYENISTSFFNNLNVYSVYSSSIKKNTSCEGLTLYAFKHNYELVNEMPIYMKLEFNDAKTGRRTPLCPFRTEEISLKNLSTTLYFPCVMTYNKENGYLFIPQEKQQGSTATCWGEYNYDGFNTGVLFCGRPKIKNESGIDF